jgi:protoporphyrinogen oxidase
MLLGLNKSNLNDYTAIYVPDKQVMPHRLGFPSNFSTRSVPEGKSSMLAEITCSVEDITWMLEDKVLIDQVIKDISCMGIINGAHDICYVKVKRSPYAYVVYDLNYIHNIKIVKDFFNNLGIILLGRFSEFEYLNMDACVRRAMKLSEELNSNEG